MSTPKLSVVMPLLNQRAFLCQAVASVMAQDVDLELVVMDGGSSDGSLQLLAELAAAHSGRLRWYSAPDNGPAQAINRAVHLTRGTYLGWLPADDLYTPGAAARALNAFRERPELQIVYGHGEHVDVAGRSLGPYPTLGSETPLQAFADGCFVCQPTLFMRRQVWIDSGGLDEGLRASFDFELWLRLFRRHAGCIGFVDAVQAQSRLHTGGITLRERQRVALEGLQLLQRHLGQAPLHWLLSYFNERLALHPFEAVPCDLRTDFDALAAQASGFLSPADRDRLRSWLDGHAALRLSRPELGMDLEPDGWLLNGARILMREAPASAQALILTGEHAHPHATPLELSVQPAHGPAIRGRLAGNGAFELRLPLAQQFPGERQIWRLTGSEPFVPAEIEPASTDRRRLLCRVTGLRFETRAESWHIRSITSPTLSSLTRHDAR